MSHALTTHLEDRHRRIRHGLIERSLDALVVTSLPNVLYLTNFGGSAGIAVLTRDRLTLITDFRYVETVSDIGRSRYACPGLELAVVDGSYDATLAAILAALPSARVGFEAAHLSVSRHDWLRATLAGSTTPPELVATVGLVERARTRKDVYELEVLKDAARRLSQVAVAILSDVGRDRTEREIALDIDWAIRRAGFERSAFDTIVASGPNAALPHARPGERKLIEGDLVVLDFGGVYDSYCVDLTRTLSVGRPSARARSVHAAVLNAHDQAIAACGPGRSRFDIDAAARDALTRAGMADAFGHGTGHGLGIEVHEDPRISRRQGQAESGEEAVEAGMVFTIEPGAYFPGWGGVRIEDDVAITQTGVELLTDVTTALLEI
jgi:Xaa-Pro aminopeptidase